MRDLSYLQKYCAKPIVWQLWRYLQTSTVQGLQITSLGFFIGPIVRNLELPKCKDFPKRPDHFKFKFELEQNFEIKMFKKWDWTINKILFNSNIEVCTLQSVSDFSKEFEDMLKGCWCKKRNQPISFKRNLLTGD